MAVREQLGGERRELPALRRSSPPDRRRRRGPLDQPVLGQRLEVLAHGGVGEAELLGQLGRGGRLDALQPFDDAALGVGQRRHTLTGYCIFRSDHLTNGVRGADHSETCRVRPEVGRAHGRRAAGRVAGRAASARAACSPRSARCRWWSCGTRGGPGRSRTGAPTSASRCTGARSRRACSPATGTTPGSTWPAAARSTRGPTTPSGFDVAVDGDDVLVVGPRRGDPVEHLRRRLRDGLEQRPHPRRPPRPRSACSSATGGADEVVRTALDFGLANRDDGWGIGLTVLVAMANVLPHLDPTTGPWPSCTPSPSSPGTPRGDPPRFADRRRSTPPGVPPGAPGGVVPPVRRHPLGRRRRAGARPPPWPPGRAAGATAEAMQLAAATDHVFIDEGHTLDFTNKAVRGARPTSAPTGPSTAFTVARGPDVPAPTGPRSRRSGGTRVDLVALVERADAAAAGRGRQGRRQHVRRRRHRSAGRCWRTIPRPSSRRCSAPPPPAPRPSSSAGPSPSPPPCASPASTSRTTTATGTRSTTPSPRPTRCTRRCSGRPSPELLRGVLHGALRVYLDRFLNVPAARLPEADAGDARPSSPRCGTSRAASTGPAPSWRATCAAAAHAPS